MTTPRPPLARLLFAVLLGCAAAHAQPARNNSNDPAAAFVYPAGGRVGTTFEVTVGGQRVLNATAASLSVAGASVEVVGAQRMMNQKELNFLENNLTVLQNARAAAKDGGPAWTADDQRLLDRLKAERENRPNRQMPTTLAESVTLRVTLPPDAPNGPAELRLAAPGGLSNPLVFQVGDLPEFIEPLTKRGYTEVPGKDTIKTTDVILPVLINGRLMPADTDRYRFAARRGQRLVFSVSARALIPYLADAVPGWFQAVLSLRDSTGREVAYLDDFRQNPDPTLMYEVQRDGDYVLEITDALHRGREDFVYRIAAGQIPCVTGIFPLGGDGTRVNTVRLHGWNLPTPPGVIVESGPTGPVHVQLPRGVVAAGPLDFYRDTGPELAEPEPNDSAASAPSVTMPVVVNGTISGREDADHYRVAAKAGDVIVAEVNARRLGSPLDSVMTIGTPDGRVLASNDDHEDPSAGLVTHQADSLLRFTVPEDGDYVVGIRDTASNGGEDHAYRLRIGPPRPGFTVEFTPSSFLIRPGAKTDFKARVVRRDGFTGPITLTIDKSVRDGLRIKDAVIPADKDEGKFSVSASSTLPEGIYTLAINAGATIDGVTVSTAAVPADDRMQAFLPRHLVPARRAEVLIARSAGWRKAPQPSVESPIKIPLGGEISFVIPMPELKGVNKVWAELRETAEGITLSSEPCAPGGDLAVTLRCDAARFRAGMLGGLTLAVLAEDATQPVEGGRRLGQLQPLNYEITPASP